MSPSFSLDASFLRRLPWPVVAQALTPDSLTLALGAGDNQALPMAEEEDPLDSARTPPDGVHRLLRLGSALDQTHTGLVRSRAPLPDPPWLLRLPEEEEADTEAGRDPTQDLARRPQDVEAVAEATSTTAEGGARVATVMIATMAVGPDLQAEAATAAVVVGAVDTDEPGFERIWTECL